jgi:DNA polymerase II large subunit
MVSSVRAGMMAQEKEKKRQTRLAEEMAKNPITPSEVVVATIIEQNPLEILEAIENVEPKAEQSTEENKSKKTYKAKKQGKNNNKILKDS